MKKIKAIAAVAATSAALAASGVGHADTVKTTIASSHPTTIAWVGVLSSHVVPESNKRLQSEDLQVKWTEAYGGTLYKFKSTLEAVEEGLTDVGWVSTLPFVTDDTHMMLEQMNQMALL